jgi:DnaJ homologue, subfamily C, member 28, conserved domain
VTPRPKPTRASCDADGPTNDDPPPGRAWESLTDRLIREAAQRGEFDNLPLHGQPLPNRDNPYAGEQALAFSVLENAGVAPPWIEADKEVRARQAERAALLARAATASSVMRRTLHTQLTRIVERHNDAVARVNAGAPTARQHRRPLVLAQELEALDAAIGPDHACSSDPSSRPPGAGRAR